MHRRKKKLSIPIALKGNLDINIKTGSYDVEENGITYHLDLSQMTALKLYMHEQRQTSVESWYNSLDRFEKKRISKTGALPQSENYYDGETLD